MHVKSFGSENFGIPQNHRMRGVEKGPPRDHLVQPQMLNSTTKVGIPSCSGAGSICVCISAAVGWSNVTSLRLPVLQ